MNRKKVLLIILIIIIAALVSFEIYRNQPKQIISNVNYVNSIRVSYNGSAVDVDEKKIIDILGKYSSKRTSQNYFPYQTDKISIEIDFNEKHDPKHILLGEFNIWYKSADEGVYNILNAQELKDELKRIIK